MAGVLAEMRVEQGIDALRCPVTGMLVFDSRSGFDDRGEHSPHLRFFVDWIGQVWMPRPEDLPAGGPAATQRRLLELWSTAGPSDTLDTLLERWRAVLPATALVLRIEEPGQEGAAGSTCWACFDLAPLDGTNIKSLRLYEV